MSVDLSVCVRCSGCSILAPSVFAVTRKGSQLIRQPQSSLELAACRAAALVCPTRAIAIASER